MYTKTLFRATAKKLISLNYCQNNGVIFSTPVVIAATIEQFCHTVESSNATICQLFLNEAYKYSGHQASQSPVPGKSRLLETKVIFISIIGL